MRKTLLFLALLMLSCGTTFAEQDSIPGRKKVGVVLSGGGAKGMAHIGVLKVGDKREALSIKKKKPFLSRLNMFKVFV